jgi:hypothetical protein
MFWQDFNKIPSEIIFTFLYTYIYKIVQHANYTFEKKLWPLFSSSIKKENVINECIAKMLTKCLLLWTNVLLTHVIAFQILNKIHMCYYMAMNKLSKNHTAKFLDLWLHIQSQNVTQLTTQLYNPIEVAFTMAFTTIACNNWMPILFYLLIWLILMSLFKLKLNYN